MPQRTLDMNGINSKFFVANSNRGAEYYSTIQNLSGQTLTVTVTNMDIQGNDGPPEFDDPASGPVTILDGAVGQINEPYDGWRLDLAGPGTGFVYITESGA